MSREQQAYARWLAVGVGLGFAALAASFFVYVTGILPPGIPPEMLPRYWALPVHEYVKATGAREVITHHGFKKELAQVLREEGIDARALGSKPQQLTLF